ncbi:MAG: DedA [bacterium]|nr:MAG: DedA [bacterium]
MKKITTLVMLVVVCLTVANTSFGKYDHHKTTNLIENSNDEASAQFISVEELKSKMSKKESMVILDVRGGDYDSSSTKIKGATRIVPSELSKHLKDIPKDKMVVTYCACPTEGGAISAAQTLMQKGFKQVYVLKGGWNGWNAASGQVQAK